MILHIFYRPKHVYRGKLRVSQDINRLGVTGSRKLRTAVTRNRVRRLLRESYRLIEPKVKTGFDMIFTMKSLKVLPDFKTVQKEMELLLFKAGAIAEEKSE